MARLKKKHITLLSSSIAFLTVYFFICSHGFSIDFYPDKARYVPGEKIQLVVLLDSEEAARPSSLKVKIHQPFSSRSWTRTTTIFRGTDTSIIIPWIAPKKDFQGYLAELFIHNKLIKTTGIDVSSDWKKYPRYGYLAWFTPEIDAHSWIEELNKYHINGLQFYDFQYKHHHPLAGSRVSPQKEWKDIAGRVISGKTVQDFIRSAHNKNMMAFAYNASYAAYADAFHDGSGVQLEWAAWSDATSPRTESTIKSYGPFPGTWSTPRLLFMNQNHPGWRHYIFSRMSELFAVYPFDGWHIDTYGDRGAYDYQGNPIDFTGGFLSFTDNAKSFLQKRVLFNTVAGIGQESLALSQADFVYSELWDNQQTYPDILKAANDIHAINPAISIVFPAYLHKPLANQLRAGEIRYFNSSSVLLADAVIFASGASHLELGDDIRMLSTEYFPDDKKVILTPELKSRLRDYYDFLVIYQNYLRDDIRPHKIIMHSSNTALDTDGQPGKVWYWSRKKSDWQIIHFINLTGLQKNRWRDNYADYPEVPLIKDMKIEFDSSTPVHKINLVSPDFNQGLPEAVPFSQKKDNSHYQIRSTIPSLHYWDMLIIQ
jgi:dextranase